MNTTKFLNNYLTNNANLDISTKISKLRQDLYARGICWTDSVNGKFTEADSFRVILYLKANTISIDFDNAMVNECNGLVLEYRKSVSLSSVDKFTPLAVPVPNFNKNKVSMSQIDKYYKSDQYNLYEALDATIINLYYNGKWCISTTKGYNVGNYKFVGDLTYSDVFMRIAEANYSNFNLDTLPKHCSYSIAMRCDQYHLFNETKHAYSKNASNSYLYVLQTIDTTTLKPSNDVFVGIPYQLPVVVKSARNVSTLIDYAKHAYTKYMKAYTTNQYKYKPLYGYILRANTNSVSNSYKNILITSSLFKIIKHSLYRNRPSTINGIIAKMYVCRSHKDQNKVLFQQFESQFSKLDAVLAHVCENTLAILAGHEHSSTNELVQTFSNQLKNDILLDGTTAHLSAIYDYLHSMNYVQFIENLIEA